MKKRFSDSEVTKVTDISREYIEQFFETASDEDITWAVNTIKDCRDYQKKRILKKHPGLDAVEVEKRADRQYFGTFRAEFAKKYCSHLLARKKAPEKKSSLLDVIQNRRAALNTAT